MLKQKLKEWLGIVDLQADLDRIAQARQQLNTNVASLACRQDTIERELLEVRSKVSELTDKIETLIQAFEMGADVDFHGFDYKPKVLDVTTGLVTDASGTGDDVPEKL